MDNNIINLSVRGLVEFVLKEGSIESGFSKNSSMVEGIKGHKKIQDSRGEHYQKEVPLKIAIDYKDFIFNIEGRCDGLIEEDNLVIIEEIKTTALKLAYIEEDFNKCHWAQAKLYGYMYCKINNIQSINIRLTYFNIEDEGIKSFEKIFSIEELESFIYELLDYYIRLATVRVKNLSERDKWIKKITFPFESYRKGQREMAVEVYRAIQNGRKLFINAPTGIGKTISTLFPAIKALGEGHISKINYLTGRTITRTVAEDSFKILDNSSLKMRVLSITAKDKICFLEEKNCNKENCIYANGYYARVNEAIIEVLENEYLINREVIESYSKKYTLCPFEFSLDLLEFMDCVICDYNYVFDPRASIKRISEGFKEEVLLIDESHNLVDRGREMFSSELSKREIMDLKKSFKNIDREIYREFDKLNKEMINLRKEVERDYSFNKDVPNGILSILNKFVIKMENWFVLDKEEGKKELLEFYFKATFFIKVASLYDENYVTFLQEGEDFKVKLYCLHPRNLIKEICKNYKSTVFFSATLLPLSYHMDILGGDEDDRAIVFDSPFKKENMEIYLSKISTKFSVREKTYSSIAKNISDFIKEKKGNYLVFFPSYKYMNEIYDRIKLLIKDGEFIKQQNSMTEEERENFLEEFSKGRENSLIALGVMGGIFGEGIDLKGDKLIGVCIVGVGLPMICGERELIKMHYDSMGKSGYDYSYTLPGINKVLQGAGRLIRTEEDKGRLLLIDDRYFTIKYKRLFPFHWTNIKLWSN